MIKINVVIKDKKWNYFINNPENYLKKKIKILSRKEIFFKKKNFDFTILLSNKKEIKNLNKKFRKKNKDTDVLSFPSFNLKTTLDLIKKKNNFYLGDIVINLSKVRHNSIDNRFKDNFNKLWIHGFLHLIGYRHKNNKDYLKMKNREKKIFKMIK